MVFEEIHLAWCLGENRIGLKAAYLQSSPASLKLLFESRMCNPYLPVGDRCSQYAGSFACSIPAAVSGHPEIALATL